jgi:hypothetical protein
MAGWDGGRRGAMAGWDGAVSAGGRPAFTTNWQWLMVAATLPFWFIRAWKAVELQMLMDWAQLRWDAARADQRGMTTETVVHVSSHIWSRWSAADPYVRIVWAVRWRARELELAVAVPAGNRRRPCGHPVRTGCNCTEPHGLVRRT